MASTLIPPPPGPVHTARILIAEDDSAAANVLQTLLGRVGYEVRVASDGATALRLLEEGPPPDVLLLDWMLPEVSGLEILQKVREEYDPLSLPILMVTAKTDAASIAAAFEAGVSDYLTKPFLGAELRARIAAHLRIKQMVEERRRMDEHLAEREKLSTLGLLVSGVAHDLNNPLGGIYGQAQLLLDEEDDPHRAISLRRILAEVQRCRRIVDDLLSYARRRPRERNPVELGEVLRATLALREQHLKRLGIRYRLGVEPELPPVLADEHQLQQVFLNIVINAEHALRDGGHALEVTAERAAPSSEREPGTDWVSIAFFNDGPPIPPEVIPRIFEPLFTTKVEGEGTGLGLSICRRIVREHGGDIEVESGAHGTVFRISLPAAPRGGAPGTPGG